MFEVEVPPRNWWEKRRFTYNAALITALIMGYLAYGAVLSYYANIIGQPIVDSETGQVVGHFTGGGGIETLFHCCGAVIVILIANACYLLGPGLERWIPLRMVDRYRKWTWWAGLAFSCVLPFLIAIIHLICCWFFPDAYDHTPITY